MTSARPHDSPSCSCQGCREYDELVDTLKELWQECPIDLIFEMFNADPDMDEDQLFEELKRLAKELKEPPPTP